MAPWNVVGGPFKMLLSKQDYEPHDELVQDPYTHLHYALQPKNEYGHPCHSMSDSDEDDTKRSLRRASEVHWVSGDFQSQVALAFMRYGNEAWIDAAYSAAALIITVPDWSSRRARSES